MTTPSEHRKYTRDNSVKRGYNWLFADRAMGAAGAMRSRMIAERLALKTQDGTLGQQTEMPQDEELRAMQVSVGDTYHYESPRPAASEPSTARSKTLPYVLAAALAGGGLGLGAMALMDRDPPVDQDTQYELRLSTEEAESP